MKHPGPLVIGNTLIMSHAIIHAVYHDSGSRPVDMQSDELIEVYLVGRYFENVIFRGDDIKGVIRYLDLYGDYFINIGNRYINYHQIRTVRRLPKNGDSFTRLASKNGNIWDIPDRDGGAALWDRFCGG